ncbi:dihydrolipoamide acetyltransferase family protein [Pseudolysinimonas yzui]|uniref:Dihydrolipoamide acetyltransferase component of pyruvate dehydrogenase complex n=1 Tax=Pseudolysinimonas yzui TaxID=2708254 RepID=A0A8J3GR80_9MICO|nr:dihydrolipoamide acetyltransferase family protein [Pseudolysinimonas yzui]GHF18019.1 dihydrolipoamide acetyltransferase component of pyruvate dehydrogenase complex [Pseudolysinimonas yzui]
MTLREFRLPDLGEGLTESDIVAWRIAEGESVELNQIIAEVETAKALVELPSPYSGVVAALHARAGQTVNVGDPLVTFAVTPSAAGEALEEDAPQPNLVGYGARPEHAGHPVRRARRGLPSRPVSDTAPVARVAHERPRSTPPVRHLARQLGIDLTSIAGTGPGGLITRDDVAAVANRIVDAGPVTRIPIRGVRKHTAAAMVASAFTAPHVTVFHTIDATAALELASRLTAASPGVKISLLAIVSRAVCLTLARHPELNSRWEEASQEIVHYGYVNLGIAAATDRGLVVPNVKDAAALGLTALAGALAELTAEARAGKASPERLTGGTFTITNIGVFGVEAGTPILNPGEAGILALGAAQRRPWEFQGEIALRQVMTLSLSFDHRVVDGAQGSRFLAELGAMLERADEAELAGEPR